MPGTARHPFYLPPCFAGVLPKREDEELGNQPSIFSLLPFPLREGRARNEAGRVPAERQHFMARAFLFPAAASRRAFTLVEIMIVVLIIGILLAIAVPNFIQARETSRARSCVGNLKQIDSAKTQCIIDNRLSPLGTAGFSIDGATATVLGPSGTYQLVNTATAPSYIRRMPVCPGGGVYSPNGIDLSPTCGITGAVGTGYAPKERWWHGF